MLSPIKKFACLLSLSLCSSSLGVGATKVDLQRFKLTKKGEFDAYKGRLVCQLDKKPCGGKLVLRPMLEIIDNAHRLCRIGGVTLHAYELQCDNCQHRYHQSTRQEDEKAYVFRCSKSNACACHDVCPTCVREKLAKRAPKKGGDIIITNDKPHLISNQYDVTFESNGARGKNKSQKNDTPRKVKRTTSHTSSSHLPLILTSSVLLLVGAGITIAVVITPKKPRAQAA